MSPEDEKIEALLRTVKPVAPSAAFLARLEATRPAPVQAERVWRKRFSDFAFPLAAAALLLFTLSAAFVAHWNRPVPGASAQAAAPRTVEQIDCVMGARELGIYHTPDGRPYRVVQSIGFGSATWEDVKSGERRTSTVPQQQLLLVSLHTM